MSCKKKIAFLITGELRNFMKVVEKQINFFDKNLYDVDFFILTWDSDVNYNKLPKDIIDNVNISYKPVIFDFVNREKYMLNEKKYFINKESNEIINYDYNWVIQNYFWLKIFLLFKEYKIKNNIDYVKIIRSRPDIFVTYEAINLDNIQDDFLYSSYKNCPKYGKVPYGMFQPNTKDVMNSFIEKHLNMKLKILDEILNDFELINHKQYINFDLLKVNEQKNSDVRIFCDWLNIGNFKNMEILCSTFLVTLLFLSNNKFPENFFLFPDNKKRILPYNYFIHINKVETGILPIEYQHVVNKEEYFKKYPKEWIKWL